MALSTRKKNIIIAEWKTGLYKTHSAIAKHFKIDRKTCKKILGDLEPTNADIVKAGAIVENAKKSRKNPVEILAIEKAINTLTENETLVRDVTLDILEGVKGLIQGGKAQKVVTISGDGGSMAEPIDYDLQAVDYKNAMDTVDKASITLNVNDRHAKPAQVTQATQVNNEPKAITIIRE